MQDYAGYDVAMTDRRAVAEWNRTVEAFLAHGAATPDHLAEAMRREPGFALGHAVKGLFLTLLARRELDPSIDEALAAAEATAAEGGADDRARRYVAALAACRSGRMGAAAARLEGILADHPRDSLALKLSHALRFMQGDAAEMRRVAEAAAPAFDANHPHRGYVLGCLAFAREETGAYAEAEAAGRAALELSADDAWGLHAVAHVHDMTGRTAEGVRLLSENTARWAHCNNFGYHVWWHLALFHLDRGATTLALELYDDRVRPAPTDDFRDIANAASMLMRLEIEGVDVGERWEELGALCAARTDDGCLVFADLHYLLALVRAGRREAADRLVARMARDSHIGGHDQHEVAAMVGLRSACGLLAFRDQDYRSAFRMLAAARPELDRIGGSRAQRDLFERLTVEAAMRAGMLDEAETQLVARGAGRGGPDAYTERRLEEIAARRALTVAA